ADALSARPILRAAVVPARAVQDAIDARHRAAQRVRIRDVSPADVDPDGIEIPSRRESAGDRDDLMAGVDQLPGDATPDEAGGAGHEVLRHRTDRRNEANRPS